MKTVQEHLLKHLWTVLYLLPVANIDAKYCGCTEDNLPQCGCCVDLEEFNYTGITAKELLYNNS